MIQYKNFQCSLNSRQKYLPVLMTRWMIRPTDWVSRRCRNCGWGLHHFTMATLRRESQGFFMSVLSILGINLEPFWFFWRRLEISQVYHRVVEIVGQSIFQRVFVCVYRWGGGEFSGQISFHIFSPPPSPPSLPPAFLQVLLNYFLNVLKIENLLIEREMTNDCKDDGVWVI